MIKIFNITKDSFKFPRNKIKGEKIDMQPEVSLSEQPLSAKTLLPQDFLRKIDYNGTDVKEFTQKVLSQMAKDHEILQGVFLINVRDNGIEKLRYLSGYACLKLETEENDFLPGEGLPGQAAREGKIQNLKSVPEGYMKIRTGLGEASPNSLIIIPVINDSQLFGVIELASFHEFSISDERYFYTLSNLIGGKLKSMLNA